MLPAQELTLQEFKKGLSLVDRLKYEFGIGLLGSMKDSNYEMMRGEYARVLTYKRGLHILVTLKRYKKEHRRWPDGLDEIRPPLAAEILVDPINEGDFVYKLADDGFTLYSKGENNVDEGGRYQGKPEEAPDDWPIWPPKGRKSQGKTANSK
jgi:hypothetical protein